MTTLNRERVRDVFRDNVLAALDESARDALDVNCGADDSDLSRLFKALDEQVEIVAQRYGITLVDEEVPHG